MNDPYAGLGISPNATDEEVTKAYRAMARKYHPDLHPGDKAAEAKMKEINAAYNQIQDIRSGKASYQPGGAGNASRGAYGSGGAYGNPYGNPYGGAYRGYNQNQSYYGRAEYRADPNRTEQEFYKQYRQPVHIFRLPIVRIILIIFLVRLVLSLLFGGFTRYSYSGYGDYGYYNGGSEAPYTQEYTQRTPNPAEEWT